MLIMKGFKVYSMFVIALILAACGGSGGGGSSTGGTGSGGGGGAGGGTQPAEFPVTAESVEFDPDVPVGITDENLTSQSAPSLSEPVDVEFPYDLTDPDDEDGASLTTLSVRNSCVTQTYDLASSPDKVVLYDADSNLTWPGVMLVGNDYRDGTMRQLPVPAEEREPVTVVITNVYSQSGDVSDDVEDPNLDTMREAINDLVVSSYNDDLPTGDSVSFRSEETNDLSRFMLKGNFSARYGIGSGSLGASINKTSSERTVVTNLVQKLFDVEVVNPPTKEDWFKDSFYDNTLPDLLNNGQISSTNAPVYVSKVTYGRILTYSQTTKASSSDVSTIAKASLNSLTASASLSLSTKQQNIMNESNIELAQIGGNGSAALVAATTGDWAQFFGTEIALTEAVPIMYEYKNLYDNSPAGVTERTSVTEEICTPQIVVPGPFDFAPEFAHERPDNIDATGQVSSGDFNGDGQLDLVWNHLNGNDNNFYVGLGTVGGTFDIVEQACLDGETPETCDFSDNSIPWGQHTLHTGDFNGDGFSDLLWLRAVIADDEISGYLLPGSGEEGMFNSSLLQTFEFAGDLDGLQTTTSLTADIRIDDINNDDRDDIVFWYITRSGVQNVVYHQILRSIADENDNDVLMFEDHERIVMGGFTDYYHTEFLPGEESLYSFHIIDINSDGWKDLVLSALGQDTSLSGDPSIYPERNVIVWDLNQQNAEDPIFSLGPVYLHGGRGWTAYRPLFGDFNGDATTDAAWIANRLEVEEAGSNFGAVHQAAYEGLVGEFDGRERQFWTDDTAVGDITLDEVLEQTSDLFEINVNGDSAIDVVATKFVESETSPGVFSNGIAVMKGINSGDPMFNVLTEVQQHPIQQDWQNFTYVFVGDVNGDGLEDVVWNNGQANNKTYVAIAKTDQNN